MPPNNIKSFPGSRFEPGPESHEFLTIYSQLKINSKEIKWSLDQGAQQIKPFYCFTVGMAARKCKCPARLTSLPFMR